MSTQINTASAKVRLNTTKLTDLEQHFMAFIEDRLVGQSDAKQMALRAFRSFMNPLRDPNRPIFIGFLIGPSRTGKTFIAELLAEFFHGSKDAMTKIQGGMLAERHQIQSLIGSPVGYIGYSDPNDSKKDKSAKDTSAKLAQANLDLARNGSSNQIDIILVDEFEKSHPVIQQMLLNAFDKGTIDLNNNTTTSVKNAIFILTSNLGMAEVERQQVKIGFTAQASTATKQDVANVVAKVMKESMSPEFRNRIDSVVIYEPMTGDLLLKVVDKELNIINRRIMDSGKRFMFVMHATVEAKKHLLDLALRDNGNLANLKRVIHTNVLEPLGGLIAQGEIHDGDIVEIGYDEESNAIVFDKLDQAMLIGNKEPAAKSDILYLSGNDHGEKSADAAKTASQVTPDTMLVQGGRIVVFAPKRKPTFSTNGMGGVVISMGDLAFLNRAHELQVRAKIMGEKFMADYTVNFTSDVSLVHLEEQWMPVVSDLVEIMGVEVLKNETSFAKPFKATLTIRAIPGQIRLIELRFPGINIKPVEDLPY